MSRARNAWIVAGILCLYFALLLPTVDRYGTGWDEFEDWQISQAMRKSPDGWLRGSPRDLSPTRLPMAVPAAGYASPPQPSRHLP